MLHKTYAKYYAIIYFWLRLPFSGEAKSLWKINEIAEKSSAQAACSVVQKYFEPFALGVQIRFATSHAENYLDEILSCLPVIPLKLVNDVKDHTTPLSSYGYNLLVIDGIQELKAMNLTRRNNDASDVEQKFVISVLNFQNSSKQEQNCVQMIADYFWENLFIDVKILFSLSENVVNFYTYRAFTSSHQCKQPTVIHLDTMIDGTWMMSRWRNVSSANLINLNGCPLKVAIIDSPPYLSYFPSKTGYNQFGDFEGRLIVELAKKLNFTLTTVHPKKDELRGTIFENGTTTGAIRMLQQGEADFSLGCFRYSLQRRQVLSSVLPYYQSSQVYGVNLNQRRLSSAQMLAFAFDASTWFCLFLSLQLTMAFTYFLYRQRKQNLLARNMLGRPASTAYILNLFGVSLGMPVNRLPATNFTRYTIVLWYTYGVIMRTAYLSLLFKVLQTDMYLKPPKSFDDLMSEHYKLAMIENTYASTYALSKEGEEIPTVIVPNSTDEATFDYLIQHPNELLASVALKEFLLYYMANNKEAENFFILPQNILSHHVTMYLPKFSYLTRPFNSVVQFLRYSGLIHYWAKESLNFKKFAETKTKSAKSITVTQLLGIFNIYQILISIALIIFGLELLCYRSKMKYREKSNENMKKAYNFPKGKL